MSDDQHPEPRAPISEEDFMGLLIRHEPMFRAYARSILPNWSRVDEVIQEASITMWQKLDQLRDAEGFPTWGRVIVRLKCLEAIAAMKREQKVFSEGVIQLLLTESEQIDSSLREQQRRSVRFCLREFSAAHQELLLAPYAGHGRIQRLANAQGKTANALYKLLGRLRGKLETCIRKRLSEEGMTI